MDTGSTDREWPAGEQSCLHSEGTTRHRCTTEVVVSTPQGMPMTIAAVVTRVCRPEIALVVLLGSAAVTPVSVTATEQEHPTAPVEAVQPQGQATVYAPETLPRAGQQGGWFRQLRSGKQLSCKDCHTKIVSPRSGKL